MILGGVWKYEWCLELSHDRAPISIELPGTKDARSLHKGGQSHEMNHTRGSGLLTEKN